MKDRTNQARTDSLETATSRPRGPLVHGICTPSLGRGYRGRPLEPRQSREKTWHCHERRVRMEMGERTHEPLRSVTDVACDQTRQRRRASLGYPTYGVCEMAL